MYVVFIRNWWKWKHKEVAPGVWTKERVPGPGPSRHYLTVNTEEEARATCQQYNDTHKPGPLSRKAEYTRYDNYY